MGMKLKELLEPFKKHKKRNLKIFISFIVFIIISIPLGLYMNYCFEAHKLWGVILSAVSYIILIYSLLDYGKLIDYYFNNKEN